MSQLFFSSPTLTSVNVHVALQALGLPTLGVDVQQQQARVQIPEGFVLSTASITDTLRPLSKNHQFDFAILENSFQVQAFKLLAMDMDSTLITIECIDEIADFAGKKKEVSEITEAAMRGEIKDFSESLNRRVALLKGVPASCLNSVFEERLRLSPGAEELIAFAKAKGWKTLLVSGGFTFFTDKMKEVLGLDYTRSNTLEIVDGHLTGRVLGTIVDADVKRETVLETCDMLGCDSSQAIVVGDGSNDLKMMEIAGASVAFRAKPVVQEKTDFCINQGGLDSICKWFEANA
ncbi:phosphoserine phosphatase [Limnobacter thiooxidans]|uniref:Phosphoserine phosphatase n=1 Tax=Limnobacter thiooxidans TaxID=131080 RepID=A0AA86JKS0_9BURK|nr:phosphoserine phosphatase [Limnobacter thiooxidans]BET26347.1 phosphoserine phosphatase SerB [Limnobacter thiooxidans]